MPNMSYCRFRNTLNALRDCYYNLDCEDLSEEEYNARKQMVEMCMSIANEYVHLLDEDYAEPIDAEEEWCDDDC